MPRIQYTEKVRADYPKVQPLFSRTKSTAPHKTYPLAASLCAVPPRHAPKHQSLRRGQAGLEKIRPERSGVTIWIARSQMFDPQLAGYS